MDCLLLYAGVSMPILVYYIRVVVSVEITPYPRAAVLHIQIIFSAMCFVGITESTVVLA
jgi:hypothetical protein